MPTIDPLTYLMLMVLNGLGQGYYFGCRDQKGGVDTCCKAAVKMVSDNRLAKSLEGAEIPCAEFETAFAKSRETKATKK